VLFYGVALLGIRSDLYAVGKKTMRRLMNHDFGSMTHPSMLKDQLNLLFHGLGIVGISSDLHAAGKEMMRQFMNHGFIPMTHPEVLKGY